MIPFSKFLPQIVLDKLSGEGFKAINALAIRVLAAGISFLMQLLLARWLGVEEYGVYAFVWTCIIIFAGGSELGFAMSSMRFLPIYQKNGQLGLARGFFRSSYTIAFFSSTIVAALGALGVYLFKDYMDSAYIQALYLGFICFPLYTLTEIGDGNARAQGWINLALLPIYVFRPLLILLLTWLLLYMGGDKDAETIMIAAIIATYLVGVAQVGLVALKMRPILGHVTPEYDTKHWVKTSIPIFAADGIYVLFTNADILIVGSMLGPDATGLYFAAVKVAMLLSLITFAVGAAWGPRFTAAWDAGNKAEMQRLCTQTVHFTFWPTLLGVCFVALVGKLILGIFGPEFDAAYPILLILLVGLAARAATGAMDRLLTLAGQQNKMAKVFGLTLLMNIVLNVSLIPFFGINGAAIATTLSLTAQAIGVYLAAKQTLNIHAFIFPLKVTVKEEGDA